MYNIGKFSFNVLYRNLEEKKQKKTLIRWHGKKNDVHVESDLNDIQDVPCLGLFLCVNKVD